MATSVPVDGRTRDTRERIRVAAARLFYAQGFAGTPIREITSACSVTPGALYNHFPSKEDLLADIYHEARQRIDELIANALEVAGESPARALALMAREITWFHAEHRELAMVVRTQHTWLPAKEQQELLDWQMEIRRSVERLLTEGSAVGEVRIPLVDQLEEAVGLTAKGLLDMWTQVGAWFSRTGGASSQDVARLYARLTLQSLGAPPQDALIDIPIGVALKPVG